MKITTISQAILLCHAAKITPWIWGHRGLGKSSIVKQTAHLHGMGFIDLRASQIESSDLRGLPDRENGLTVYRPPADLPLGDYDDERIKKELGETPDWSNLEEVRLYQKRFNALQPHFQRGILFLDELNRAQSDVMQAAFQLVLDRCVGQYTLPPGWMVVAAGNFNEGDYQVNGFTDAALLNRFCHLTLSSGDDTLEDWIKYMTVAHGESASQVIEFASQNVKHLDGDVKGELGFTIQPSRRSWEMVTNVCKAADAGNVDQDTRLSVISGLIGRELALSFSTYSCPVKPRDILNDGVKRHDQALLQLTRGQLKGLVWGLVAICKEKVKEKKIAMICLDFAEHMLKNQKAGDKDLIVAFCRALVTDGKDGEDVRSACISNPQMAALIADFNKKNGKDPGFVDLLNERKELSELLSRTAWGSGN